MKQKEKIKIDHILIYGTPILNDPNRIYTFTQEDLSSEVTQKKEF